MINVSKNIPADVVKSLKGLDNIPSITILDVEVPQSKYSRYDIIVFAVHNETNEEWIFVVECKDRNIPSTKYNDLIFEEIKRVALDSTVKDIAMKYPNNRVAWLLCQTYTDGIMKIGSADSAFYVKDTYCGATTQFSNTTKVTKKMVHITETKQFRYDKADNKE